MIARLCACILTLVAMAAPAFADPASDAVFAPFSQFLTGPCLRANPATWTCPAVALTVTEIVGDGQARYCRGIFSPAHQYFEKTIPPVTAWSAKARLYRSEQTWTSEDARKMLTDSGATVTNFKAMSSIFKNPFSPYGDTTCDIAIDTAAATLRFGSGSRASLTYALSAAGGILVGTSTTPGSGPHAILVDVAQSSTDTTLPKLLQTAP